MALKHSASSTLLTIVQVVRSSTHLLIHSFTYGLRLLQILRPQVPPPLRPTPLPSVILQHGKEKDAERDAGARIGAEAEVGAAASECSPERWHSLFERVLMPALRRGLRLPAEKDHLRQDLLRLLGAVLLVLPSLQPELSTLLSAAEPEADFFANITHVQVPPPLRLPAATRRKPPMMSTQNAEITSSACSYGPLR